MGNWSRAAVLAFGVVLALGRIPLAAAAEVELSTGVLTNAISIEVPPFHGIEPKLALSYRSDAGNGFVGVGWSLHGVSTIERAGRGRGSPWYNSGDLFRLDGQELVASTSLGGTHCTKEQSFQRIAYDDATDAWTVTAKDGTRAVFQPVYVVTKGTLRWGLASVTDTSGNVVSYGWQCLAGDCYPSTVTYGGYQVTFFPESRPDTVTFPAGDALGTTTYRLRSVLVSVPGVSNVRAYRLGYAASPSTSRSVLTSVQLYGRDVTHDGNGLVTGGTALPAMTFATSPGGSGFAADQAWATGDSVPSGRAWMADVDGDGRADLVHQAGSGTHVLRSTGTSFVHEVWGSGGAGDPGYTWMADVNGDGKADVVYMVGNQLFVKLSTGRSFEPDRCWGTATWAWTGWASPMWMADVDGDGRADVVYEYGAARFAKLSLGTAFQTEVYASAPHAGGDGRWMVDVNGDGHEDIVIQRGGETLVRLSIGHAFLPEETWLAAGGSAAPDLMWAQDVNGDRLADVIFQDGPSTIVKLSTGTSFLPDQVWATGGSGAARSMWVADVDGDGKSDVVYHDAGTVGVKLASGGPPDLLSRIASGLGGSTAISYSPATAWPRGNGVPRRGQTVSRLVTSDGRGDAVATSYRYAGGKDARGQQAPTGFLYAAREVACDASATACTAPGAPPVEEWWFQQDWRAASKPTERRISTRGGIRLVQTLWEYDIGNRGTSYTALQTGQKTFTYDGSGDLTCPGPSCRQTYAQWTYDSYGNVTQVTDHGDVDVSGDERTTTYSYVPNVEAYIVNLPAEIAIHPAAGPSTAAPLSRTSILYDEDPFFGANVASPPTAGRPTARMRWLNEWSQERAVSTRASYDAHGNLASETDGLGNRTSVAFDATYNLYPVSITDALGRVTRMEWDPVCSARTAVIDAVGQRTTFTYDALCRLVRTTLPLGAFEARSYVNTGNPNTQYVQLETPSADARGNQWVRRYVDGLGRIWRTVEKGPAAGSDIAVDVRFDALGHVERRSAPYYPTGSLAWTQYAHDELGRLTRVTNPDQTTRTAAYTHASASWTDEGGHTTVDVLDAHGQVITHREFFQGVVRETASVYDGAGRLVEKRDSAGNVWTWSYDTLGRLVQSADPDRGGSTYTYDDADRLQTQRDAKGQATRFDYDALHELTAKITLHGTAAAQTVSYGYDALGRLTSMTDGAGRLAAGYDALGRLTSATRIIDGISYRVDKGYDLGGRLLWTTYVSPTETSSTGTSSAPLRYDGAGRLATIPGFVTSALYDAQGRLTQQTNANGTVTTRTYSGLRPQLTGLVTAARGQTIQSLTYGYDVEGKLVRIASPFAYEGWTYGYDELHQLTSAKSDTNAAFDRAYAYDALGNITWSSRLGAYTYPTVPAWYSQPGPHAVQRAGADTFTYDSNGNMTSGGGRTITWDAENRPIRIDGFSYAYDGFGQRIKAADAATTTHYLGDDYEVTNGRVTRYVELAGLKVARVVGGVTTWLHPDHQGSIQVVTDAAGNVIERQHYLAYGDRLEGRLTPSAPGYAGERGDATGLLYLHARYYDPILARFISPDPTVPTRLNIGLNRYAYAGNDPIDHVDRNGLSWLSRAWGKVSSSTSQFVHWVETRKPLPTNTGFAKLDQLDRYLNGRYQTNVGMLLRSNPYYFGLTGDWKGTGRASLLAGLYVGSYSLGGWPLVAIEVLGVPYQGPSAKDLDRPQKGLATPDADPAPSTSPERQPGDDWDPSGAPGSGNEGLIPPIDAAERVFKTALKYLFPGVKQLLSLLGVVGDVTAMKYEQNLEQCRDAWGPPKPPTMGPQDPGVKPAPTDGPPDAGFSFGPCGSCYNQLGPYP